MERGKPDKNFAYVDFGNSPGDAMVCNYFLWYTNALYDFIGVFKRHPGGHQITRRFTFDEVKPNYGEDGIACALNLANFALLLLMRMFWMSLSAQREADEIAELLARYSAEFNGRLNQGE